MWYKTPQAKWQATPTGTSKIKRYVEIHWLKSLCFGAIVFFSLQSGMLDYVACDRRLEKAYFLFFCREAHDQNIPGYVKACAPRSF